MTQHEISTGPCPLEMAKFENDRLWNYFNYHAKQRLDTFKFFTIISGLYFWVLHGLLFSAINTSYLANISAMISVVYLIGTIVFFALDCRNKLMISTSVDLLIQFEKDNHIKYNIFTTSKQKKADACLFGFDIGLGVIFTVALIIGFVSFIYSIIQVCCN